MRTHNRLGGFTLVELMVAVAIVGILTAIALPSYAAHMRSSRRGEAQAYLMAVATRQQQFLVDTRGYASTLTVVALAAPPQVSAAYNLTLATVNGPPPSFLLSATPIAGTGQELERCGALTIDQNGAKTSAHGNCW